MKPGRTTSRGAPPSSESTATSGLVSPDRVEVIRPEAIDYAEDMILRTLQEAAAEYQAKRKAASKRGVKRKTKK